MKRQLSMCRFATLWHVDCEWEPQPGSKHSIIAYEPIAGAIDIPESARPSFTSWDVTFWDKTGNKQSPPIHIHNREGACGEVGLFGDTWYEIGIGEAKFVHGCWHIVRVCWKNSRLAKMMNAGWKAYKQ